MPLAAVIFDFDGVLADSEPVHLHVFQTVLDSIGIRLTADEYYERYLGYSDRDAFVQVLTDRGLDVDQDRLDALLETVRAVAEAMRERDATLGLLPSGTGNLLARNIGVPFASVEAACAVAFDGATRRIDIGVATAEREDGSHSEHAFLVMAGIGIDAEMIANTRPELKRRFGWLAYVDAGFRSIPKARKLRVRFRLEGGHERSAHVSTILFANCGVLPGNMELIPDGAVDDGLLDVAILQPASVFGWLAIWRKVTWENRVLRKSALGRRIIRFTDRAVRTRLSYLRGSSVQVRLERPEPFELDGDAFGDVVGLDLAVDERALRVRVPA